MECQLCRKKILLPSQFRTHMQEHGVNTFFNCNQCGKQFSQKSNLNRHMNIHSGKQYQCADCQKIYTTKQSLQRHQDSHNSIIVYHCDICDKNLKTERTLKQHQMIMHRQEHYEKKEQKEDSESSCTLCSVLCKHNQNINVDICYQCCVDKNVCQHALNGTQEKPDH